MRPWTMRATSVATLQGGAGELLGQEDGDALGRDGGDQSVQLVDDERGQTHRDLVQQAARPVPH